MSAPPATAPNVIVGLILNLLLPGSGFTYIGRWHWHLRWIAIMAALTVLGLVVSAMLGIAVPVLLPILGLVAMIVHYGREYAAQRDVDFQPHLPDGVKIGLIVGHVVLNVVGTILLTSVLPNLSGARTRAIHDHEQRIVRDVGKAIATQDLDGTLKDGPCDLSHRTDMHGTWQTESEIASCVLDATVTPGPAIPITFRDDHTLGRS